MDIGKALRDGWTVLIKNPIIFVPAFVIALLSTYLSSITPSEIRTVPEMLGFLSTYIPITILVS
ncbi:MAG: hypothetical protein QMD12_02130, partial [Candidatus Aenigmarchaeota archaeon]|nr:hypothetical protein [Candidatus Aenigmarchaeota archaeon]